MTGVVPRREIRRLLPSTIERIAAGEVVDRPASVVKELVENAYDAGASQVVVRLSGGGVERIEVADDGSGIPPEELPLAVERHATSKLDPAGSPEAIGSLGFRGEALASIGAVARLRITSRPPDRDAAEGISVVGGSVVGRYRAARAPGSTVEVEDLFFNTPARRKFLKSAASEQVEVVRTVERLYLAQPTVGVRVESEGREVLAAPPTTRLQDAAATVLGPAFLSAEFPVGGEIPGGHLYGAVGRPSVAAATSGQLYLAVNGRSVVSRPLLQAARAAFADALPRSRFPVGVLHLEVDRTLVDVNVHPTKREVRFARESDVVDAVRRRVRESLLRTPTPSDPSSSASPAAEALGSGESVLGILRSESTSPAARQETLEATVPTAAVAAAPASTAGERFELLGAYDALYWVAVTAGGLLLIDQHAASERLLFERLRRDGTLARQALVDPATLRLSAAQRSAWRAHAEEVRRAGFELDAFGPDAVRVRSVPTYRGRSARAEAVADLLSELAEGSRPTLPDGLAERAAATIACHAALRAGDVVPREEVLRVLSELEALPERVRSCPHGRPIFVRISRARLDGWFLRRGT